MKILLLEDDKLFNDTIEDFLEEEGFEIVTTLDPYSALDIIYQQRFDLYLFDVNLPYENGFALLKQLRESGDSTPTIFITSREDKASLQEGFERGGDDYLQKPVDLDELLWRMHAVLRRQTRRETIKIDAYDFDIVSQKLSLDGVEIGLSLKATLLLLTLLERQGEVISLSEIKERLWSSAEEASEGSLRVYITQLKKYFPKRIENIRSIGYRMSLS